MDYVFAQTSVVLYDDQGLPFTIREGQAWRADDPLVAKYSAQGYFGPDPTPRTVGTTTLPQLEPLPAAGAPAIERADERPDGAGGPRRPESGRLSRRRVGARRGAR